MQGKAVDSILGTCVRAKLDKCKVSDSAHREVDFYLISGEGVDNVRTVIELAIKSGVISKKGAWFSWNGGDGEIRSQGLNSFKESLSEDHVNQIFAQVKPFLADPKNKTEDKPSLEDIELGDLDDMDDILGDL